MSYRVLIAEDSATMQRVLEIAFAGEDAQLHVVQNGHEALDAALALRPDVVVAEARLPGLDGYALSARLAAEPRLHALPVLLLTDGQQPFAATRVHGGAAPAHLQKPFAALALKAAVHRAMCQPAAERSAAPSPVAEAPSPVAEAPSPVAEAPSPVAEAPWPHGREGVAEAATNHGQAQKLRSPAAQTDEPAAAANVAPVRKLAERDDGTEEKSQQDASAASRVGGEAALPVPPPRYAAAPKPAKVAADTLALPPLPNWDAPLPRPGDAKATAATLAQAVAEVLAQLAPNLDATALNARVAQVVEREVVAILWQVVPRLAEEHLLAAKR